MIAARRVFFCSSFGTGVGNVNYSIRVRGGSAACCFFIHILLKFKLWVKLTFVIAPDVVCECVNQTNLLNSTFV